MTRTLRNVTSCDRSVRCLASTGSCSRPPRACVSSNCFATSTDSTFGTTFDDVSLNVVVMVCLQFGEENVTIFRKRGIDPTSMTLPENIVHLRSGRRKSARGRRTSSSVSFRLSCGVMSGARRTTHISFEALVQHHFVQRLLVLCVRTKSC